jgi:hypothetical protein
MGIMAGLHLYGILRHHMKSGFILPILASKIRNLYNEVGGFGCLLVLVYDHWQDQKGWEQSTRLLAEEVMPRLAALTGA